MVFAKQLRERVRNGEITCSVRIWQRPHVKAGGTYAMPPGRIRITSIDEIGFQDVTPALARRSGFEGIVDLLKTAKHGHGDRVYLIEFVYEEHRTTVSG